MNHTKTAGGWMEYLLYGGGAWASRWQCTDHDIVLAVVSAFGCLWMLWGCSRYILVASKVGAHEMSEHNRQLRWVFIQMAAINAVTMLLVWVWPAYYIAAALCWLSAYQMGKLTRAKLVELADAEYAAGRRAAAKLRKVEQELGTEVVEEIAQGTTDELMCTLIKRIKEAQELTQELGSGRSRKLSGV